MADRFDLMGSGASLWCSRLWLPACRGVSIAS